MPDSNDTPHPLTIVSGLPRSGTSMMMRMLGAGGMPLMTDHHRPPDTGNPYGYFEYEPVKRLHSDAVWLLGPNGAAVKIISLLLPAVPKQCRCNVLFMNRPLGEILASQRRLMVRRGHTDSQDSARIAALYERHLFQIGAWLKEQPNMHVCPLAYSEVIHAPHETAQEIARFVSRDLDIAAMAGSVDPDLYRHRVPHGQR